MSGTEGPRINHTPQGRSDDGLESAIDGLLGSDATEVLYIPLLDQMNGLEGWNVMIWDTLVVFLRTSQHCCGLVVLRTNKVLNKM